MDADDTPRDPLAALWKQIVYEEEERPVVGLDPLGDRIFARLVAAGVTLDATRPSGDEALRAAAVRRLTSFFERGFDGVGYSYALETVEVIGNAIWDAALATPSSAPDVEGLEFDADRMTHAWSILEAEVVAHDFPDGTRGVIANPDRWEPDRYNAAAFVTALLRQYAALRDSRS